MLHSKCLAQKSRVVQRRVDVTYIRKEKMMNTIVIANQKGGIGKTTTATSLAAVLPVLGYKTLLIDADKQGSASDTYRASIDGVPTLYDVLLDDDRIPIQEAIQHTESGDIVPSDPLLKEADAKLSGDPDGDFRLADSISALDGTDYDYVIIDTPPDINHILYNALIAANKVIIPVTADRYALIGLSRLSDIIEKIQKRQNPKLELMGILLTKYNNRTVLSKETMESLLKHAEKMNTSVFQTTIRESVKAKEAQALRTSLISYAPKSTTCRDYLAFAEEFLKMEGAK